MSPDLDTSIRLTPHVTMRCFLSLTLVLCVLLAACSGDDSTSPTPSGEDTKPPVVTIVSPSVSGSYETMETTVSVSGTAQDDRGVTSVGYAVSGGATGTASGTSSWSFSVTLAVGTHSLVVEAMDAAGNAGTATFSVVVKEPPPPTTPTISAPARLNVEASGTASIEAQPSSSYEWTIQGGEIVGATDGTEIEFRPSSAGHVRLAATVTNAAGVASEPGEATVQAFAVIHVMLGDHVAGTPAAGTLEHDSPETLPFTYEVTGTGLKEVRTDVSGILSGGSGEVSPTVNHTIWAWAEPSSGTEFSDMVVVPSDPTVIPYPEFYENRPAVTTTLADPYCAVAPSHVAYPRSYLGDFPMPAIRGAPFPGAVERGVYLKDYWYDDDGGDPSGHGNGVCPASDWYAALDETMARLRALGADHVGIMQSAPLVDPEAEILEFECMSGEEECYYGSQLADSDIIQAAALARSHGLDVYLGMQVDDRGASASGLVTLEWADRFFDAWLDYMLHTADVAERAGVSVLQVDWGVSWVDWTRDGYKELFQTRMTEIAREVSNVFSGELSMGVIAPWSMDSPELMEHIDIIIIELWNQLPLDEAENAALSTDLLKDKLLEIIESGYGETYRKYGKPAEFRPIFQSFEDYWVRGWVEDGFCTHGCEQESLEIDFSVQAISLEAAFEAIQEQSSFAVAAVTPMAYWFTGSVLPNISFPNMSQSMRSKPGESVLYHWFKR